MRILVSGGVQKQDAHQLAGEHRYEFARVSELDSEAKTERAIFDYKSPAAHCPAQEPSIVFTAAHVDETHIYAPTKTELVIWRRAEACVEQVISLPAFHDVHHVRPGAEQGGLWVVNTGLDQVLEVSRSGELIRAHCVVAGDPWERFDRTQDYRLITSTKPHAAHPNYLCEFEGRWWVTRFKQRDCVELGGEGRMPIDVQGCHDGVAHGDHVFFTTVDGHLVKTRPGLARPAQVWDLNTMDGGVRKLGWCRGLVMLNDHEALVGFSRLRITKWRDNVAWAGGLAAVKALGHRPTRVSLFDLRAGKVRWTQPLESLDAIFSIHLDAAS